MLGSRRREGEEVGWEGVGIRGRKKGGGGGGSIGGGIGVEMGD